MLIINFKTYHESTGENALKLAKIIDEAAENAPTEVLIAVQALDLEKVAKSVKNVKVLAQHIDGVGYGARTGHIIPQEVKSRGAIGTLLNHSECPIPEDLLGETIDIAQAHFPDYTIVCTPSYESTVHIETNYDPRKIAFEPSELIGGDISVATAQPEIIEKVVGISPERQILVGAGVKTVDDIKISLELGAIGILVASGVVKNEDPAAVVRDFLSAWKDS
jgi:triosephosphate isomerase